MKERGLFDTIVGSFRQRLSLLPDKRRGKNTRYGMEDAALSAFSVFFPHSAGELRKKIIFSARSTKKLENPLPFIG
ncbi:MAG: hypothetical protein V7K53_19880 [Nostoc sp.]